MTNKAYRSTTNQRSMLWKSPHLAHPPVTHTTSNLCTMIYDLYNVCRSASNGTLCSGVARCVKAQVQKFCLGPPHSGIPINLSSGSHQRIRKLISFSRFSIFNLHRNLIFFLIFWVHPRHNKMKRTSWRGHRRTVGSLFCVGTPGSNLQLLRH